MTMNVRAAQLCMTCLVKPTGASAEVAQFALSCLVKNGGTTAQAVQLALSALVKNGGTTARQAQLIMTILVWSGLVTTPPIFPTLVGLSYSVLKRPFFYNSQAKSGSGYTTRIAYATTPTYEWDLTFERLEDYSSTSEFKKFLGFYMAMQGGFMPFLWQDPYDYSVTAQPIGTTDGSTTTWTLARTYGSGQTETENIGYLNTAATFNVYLNGTLQSPSTYSTVTATPCQQLLVFTTAPTTGQALTVDMSYYYYVHFKDDNLEFENFLYQLWSLKKVTIESLKG